MQCQTLIWSNFHVLDTELTSLFPSNPFTWLYWHNKVVASLDGCSVWREQTWQEGWWRCRATSLCASESEPEAVTWSVLTVALYWETEATCLLILAGTAQTHTFDWSPSSRSPWKDNNRSSLYWRTAWKPSQTKLCERGDDWEVSWRRTGCSYWSRRTWHHVAWNHRQRFLGWTCGCCMETQKWQTFLWALFHVRTWIRFLQR